MHISAALNQGCFCQHYVYNNEAKHDDACNGLSGTELFETEVWEADSDWKT